MRTEDLLTGLNGGQCSMKMKRVVAMMLLFACLFNVIIAGFSEQQSSSPIIQAVVPYLNSCMNFDDIENYELDSSWDIWDRNTCIVQFDITDGNKTIEGKLETDRNKPVKINVFLQKADKLGLMLLDGYGHTVVDVPQGYLHG